MIEITVPINPRLHAHAKGHWRQKAAATKLERSAAKLLAMGQPSIHGRAVVDYRFTVPDRRRRDLANMIQAMKPAIDGVVDAGRIAGDHWEALSIGVVSVDVGKGLFCKLVFKESDGNGIKC